MKKVVLAAVALSIALPVAAQQTPQGQQQQPQQQQQEREKQVGTTGASMATVEKIVDQPNEFYGKQVTVMGQVGQALSQQAFQLQKSGAGAMAEDHLLVLWPQATQRMNADSQVRVTGKIERFDRNTLQREHNIKDWSSMGLDESNLSKYENKPVLIASNVEMSGREK